MNLKKIPQLMLSLLVVALVGVISIGCAESKKSNAEQNRSLQDPLPLPPINLHFQKLYDQIGTAKYLTYDLKLSGISQGDPSTPTTTVHGFMLLEYLDKVDDDNLHVRIHVFLSNGPFAEDNTVLTTHDPHLQVDFDAVAAAQGVGRGALDYAALKLVQVGDPDHYQAETMSFPTKGKIFFSPTKVANPGPNSDYYDGKLFDSAHDKDHGDMLSFWFVNGAFYSLHDAGAPPPL